MRLRVGVLVTSAHVIIMMMVELRSFRALEVFVMVSLTLPWQVG